MISKIYSMPTNPKKSAVNSLKNVGLLLTITPEVVDYLSANNEAIAHTFRYIMPIGYNNPHDVSILPTIYIEMRIVQIRTAK